MATVLASNTFSRAPRSAAFLKYVCEKYFEGEADQIKEYNLVIDVLGRVADFDQGQDVIVRVEMPRLRKKLTEY